jgi:hypothetical protein
LLCTFIYRHFLLKLLIITQYRSPLIFSLLFLRFYLSVFTLVSFYSACFYCTRPLSFLFAVNVCFQRSSHVLFLIYYFYHFSHFPSLDFYYRVLKCLTLFVSWTISLHFYLFVIRFHFDFFLPAFFAILTSLFYFYFCIFHTPIFSFLFYLLVVLIFSALSYIPPLFSVQFHCGHKLFKPRSLQVT